MEALLSAHIEPSLAIDREAQRDRAGFPFTHCDAHRERPKPFERRRISPIAAGHEIASSAYREHVVRSRWEFADAEFSILGWPFQAERLRRAVPLRRVGRKQQHGIV